MQGPRIYKECILAGVFLGFELEYPRLFIHGCDCGVYYLAWTAIVLYARSALICKMVGMVN